MSASQWQDATEEVSKYIHILRRCSAAGIKHKRTVSTSQHARVLRHSKEIVGALLSIRRGPDDVGGHVKPQRRDPHGRVDLFAGIRRKVKALQVQD